MAPLSHDQKQQRGRHVQNYFRPARLKTIILISIFVLDTLHPFVESTSWLWSNVEGISFTRCLAHVETLALKAP